MTELLIATALAIAIDVVTGFAGAVKTGAVMSGKMREGLWHKAGFAGLIVTAFLLEYLCANIPYAGVEVAYIQDICAALASIPLVLSACLWVIVTEAVSIMENLCVLNPAIAHSPIGRVFDGASAGGNASADEKEV